MHSLNGHTKGVQNHWGLKSHKLRHIAQNFQKPIQQLKVLKNFQVGLFQTVVWSRKVLTFLQLILVKVLDLWLCNSYLFPENCMDQFSTEVQKCRRTKVLIRACLGIWRSGWRVPWLKSSEWNCLTLESGINVWYVY